MQVKYLNIGSLEFYDHLLFKILKYELFQCIAWTYIETFTLNVDY